MVPKPTFFLVSLTLAVGPATFSQDEAAAPKISISFADEEEKAPDAPAAATAKPAQAAPTKEGEKPVEQMSAEEELFLLYGWYLFNSSNIDLVGLTKGEKLALLRGASVALESRVINEWEQKWPDVLELMEKRWAPVRERMDRERKALTVQTFAELAKKENIKKTSTGLFYELVSEGTGKFPTPDSTVTVEYVATLIDGTVFDSSRSRGPTPIHLPEMVAGVREGLQYVREGGIIKMWVPASLGFGSEERTNIPADSALLFQFTIHEILDTAPQDAQK
jgi:FKBP-type peptidyl-prolyl cis-trans isomerase FkpA